MLPVRASVIVRPGSPLRGTLTVPGDKSISHRYAIIAALASGRSSISNYAPGADCASTLRCLRALGVRVEEPGHNTVVMEGRGLRGLQHAARPLDTGNSGTTMRLLAGVLATRIGAPDTLILSGTACIIGSLLFLKQLPHMRRIARPIYVDKGIIKEPPAEAQ